MRVIIAFYCLYYGLSYSRSEEMLEDLFLGTLQYNTRINLRLTKNKFNRLKLNDINFKLCLFSPLLTFYIFN